MNTPEPNLSQKNGALVALYQLGGFVREVEPILDHMRVRLGITTDPHNVAHVLWPLSKENKIAFAERKVQGKAFLTNIRITERGVQIARDLLGEEGHGRVIPAGRGQRSAHPIGVDNTDFRNHAAVAVGGPIERRVEKETALDSVEFVVVDETEAARYRGLSKNRPKKDEQPRAEGRPVNQNEKATDGRNGAEAVSPPAEAEAKQTEANGKDASADTPTQYSGSPALKAEVNYLADDFPHIAAVLAKREKVQRYRLAAETLADDEPEIAIQLLSKVEISPLEEEIIRLIG